MGKTIVILCLSLFAAGCASNQTTSAKVSSSNVFFLATPPPDGTRVGWTSFNDHLTRHYADDAMVHMRQDAAGRGANVVVLLGVDPPNPTGRFGQFEVYGYLATVYVWADLYYCPGLTNSPAMEMPDDKTPLVQLVSARSAPLFSTLLTTTGTREQFVSTAEQLK
ncbi:MAG: hypothetical protein ABSF10_01050 [Verrucomicrobiota bacterium]|jgi:hypothetical protein